MIALEMIFQKVDQNGVFIPIRSTIANIIATSIKPVRTRAVKNFQISCTRIFRSSDLLLNTHILFVMKANTTAGTHAITVEINHLHLFLVGDFNVQGIKENIKVQMKWLYVLQSVTYVQIIIYQVV